MQKRFTKAILILSLFALVVANVKIVFKDSKISEFSLSSIFNYALADDEYGHPCNGAEAAIEWEPPSIWYDDFNFNRCSPGCPVVYGHEPHYIPC